MGDWEGRILVPEREYNDFVQFFLCFFHHARMSSTIAHSNVLEVVFVLSQNALSFNSNCHCPDTSIFLKVVLVDFCTFSNILCIPCHFGTELKDGM